MEDPDENDSQREIVLKIENTADSDSEYYEYIEEANIISEDRTVQVDYIEVLDRNEVTVYNCNSCDMTFQSVEDHIRDYHKDDEVQIEFAEEMYNPAMIYGFKEIIVEEQANLSFCFKCDICNTELKSARSLKLHMKMHEGKTLAKTVERKNHCHDCNRVFSSEEHLRLHLDAHDNENHQKKSVIDSVPEHIGNGYPCSFCGKEFKRPHEKVKHERIHTGERPYSCQICDKRFRVSSCLAIHRRTHESIRPFVCPHCKKRFKVQSAYNHHLKTHSTERQYKCPFCPKAFKTAVQLGGHKKSHTKPFSCSECNRPFGSLYAVRKHMQVHQRVDNKLSYSCDMCGANYARISALRDHQKDQHQVDGKSEMEVSGSGTMMEQKVEAEEIIEEEDLVF
ncbi:zinc finger protein 699-like [Toxorhynchites rutilus septentrionalis]|uniref:zinc finger protein 699-like n=1 Tax=Toxorhynchites rutilus septentrionalis TaxID=329112 RepID=UPI002479CD87|nr:zinc finger protein 699-like [Toxorhynchites rutilus septentrionalis]